MDGKRRRLIVALLLIVFFMAFILINIIYQVGLIYLILSIICLNIVIFWDYIPKRRPERKLFSFQKDWYIDMLAGFGVGLALIGLMSLIPGFSMASPQLPPKAAFPVLASAGQWITVVGAAPLVEEVAFRTVLFGILFIVIGLNFFWSVLIDSLAFAAFHVGNYAGEIALNPILANSGAFIAAFLVSVLICFVNYWRGSVTAGMGTHGTINGFITARQMVFW